MQEKNHTRIYYIIKGTVTAIFVTVPIFLLLTLAMSITEFPEEYLSPAILATVIVSIVVAGFIATASAADKGWFNGSLVGLLYMFIAVVLRWSMEGSISFNKDILTMLLSGVLIGSISGMAGLNLGTRIRKRPKAKGAAPQRKQQLSAKPDGSCTKEKPC